jgi:hypothetical protein
MNKLRLYLSSCALIASTIVLLVMVGTVAAQNVPLTREAAHRRPGASLLQSQSDP